SAPSRVLPSAMKGFGSAIWKTPTLSACARPLCTLSASAGSTASTSACSWKVHASGATVSSWLPAHAQSCASSAQAAKRNNVVSMRFIVIAGNFGAVRLAANRPSVPAASSGCCRRAPVVAAFRAADLVRPRDLAIRKGNFLEMREVRGRRILAVRHQRLHVDDDGVFQRVREVMLVRAFRGGAIPLDLAGQALAGDQRLVQQRRGLVEDLGDHQRLMHALAGGLAALRIARDDDLVAERLHQDLVLVAFLVDVADAVFGESAFGDEALCDPLDGHI